MGVGDALVPSVGAEAGHRCARLPVGCATDAPQATVLLELISRNPNVENAKFESPVRKDRNIERFNLSFKLNKEIFIPDPTLPANQGGSGNE